MNKVAAPQPHPAWRSLPVLAAVLVWSVLCGMAMSPAVRDVARARVPWLLEPMFHDWHVVRLAWQAEAQGVDPLASTDLPFNYPRFVLLGEKIGGATVPPIVAGLALAALFLGLAVATLRPRSGPESIWAAALVLSPPVWLVVERGNLDAMVFALVAAGLALISRRDPSPLALMGAGVALFLAAAMKLYPAMVLAGLPFLVRGAHRRWIVLLAVLFGIWFLVTLDDVALVMQKTTRGYNVAYGRMIAGLRYVGEMIAPRVPPEEASRVLRLAMRASLVAWGAGVAAAVTIGWRTRALFRVAGGDAGERMYFCSGALIFAGTFTLGSNWSYRLVFLLFCVPWLWTLRRTAALRRWATLTLAGVLVMLLLPFRLPFAVFFAQQAVMWLTAWSLLAATVAVLAASHAGQEAVKTGPGSLVNP